MPPVSATSERVELARLCSSRDWSKAIRVLDSIIASSSSSIQDICNRAFCYSRLELHKHVIRDCDRALQLDPALLQAYILKGHALSSLGRKDDALAAWELGYEQALCQSADLKQLMELEELLRSTKQAKEVGFRESVTDLMASEYTNNEHGIGSEVWRKQDKFSNLTYLSSDSMIDSITSKVPCLKFEMQNGRCMFKAQNGNFNMPSELEESVQIVDYRSTDKNNNISERNESSSVSRNLYGNCYLLGNGHKMAACSDKADKEALSNDFMVEDIIFSKGSESELNIGSNSLPEIERRPYESCNKHLDAGEKFINLNNNERLEIERSDYNRRNKRFPAITMAKPNSISVDFRLSKGIEHVNEGQYASAILIFDQILKEDPNYPEALIGRGTAYAFQRELETAITDFSHAIECNPSACEAWKRRGQARAALGESVQAIADLTKALELEPNTADILHERGIVNFKLKNFHNAIDDLSMCITLDKDYKSAYTYLGLAFSSVGDYQKAEESHLKAIHFVSNCLESWIHLIQFYIDLANATKAFDYIDQALKIDRFAKIFFLRGKLLHGMGEHRKAVKELSISLSIENGSIDCLYLRASCYHAIGEYKEAVKDYDSTLDLELDTMDKFVFQCLAFYQKEMALYTASKASSEFVWFDIDRDIDPLFKEYWCQKKHPKDVCEKVYRQTPLRESLKKGKLRKRDVPSAKGKYAILAAADVIGKNIQYHCPGFLNNKRQHRMAGLAAIEIAQKVSKAWRSLHSELKNSNKNASKYGKKPRRRLHMPNQNRGGGDCSTSSSSDAPAAFGAADDRASGRPMISWHDIYSVAVKWRQISEPCDSVMWTNKLRSGFGPHIPFLLADSKVVRHYPYFERTCNKLKTIAKDRSFVHKMTDGVVHLSHDTLRQLMAAETCRDLHKAVGEDFWVPTSCHSAAYNGKQLQGTRITLSQANESGAYDFAIRAPCTPSRWDEFDLEMSDAWDSICSAYCGEAYGSTSLDALRNVKYAILRMSFYWCNLLPLTRGSAAVGLVVLLGLLLAANMEVAAPIPQDLQVHLEALLAHPDEFVDSLDAWLNPSLKCSASWKDFPDVASTFATTASVVAALSSDD